MEISIFLIIILVVLFYFLPAIVASNRKNPQTMSIFVLNLFLGWTLLGWVIALIWACANVSETTETKKVDVIYEIDKLYDLKVRGIITEEDFQKQKEKLLGTNE